MYFYNLLSMFKIVCRALTTQFFSLGIVNFSLVGGLILVSFQSFDVWDRIRYKCAASETLFFTPPPIVSIEEG